MATEEQKRELKEKITRVITDRFGDHARAAFDHFDFDKDGSIGRGELKELLDEAGVGNTFTRGAWADAIIAEVDTTGDGRVSWEEFQRVFAD